MVTVLWWSTAGMCRVYLTASTPYLPCSDGAGRSGAFCAISMAIERVKEEGTVEVFHGVKCLRTQRPHMVQTLVRIIM